MNWHVSDWTNSNWIANVAMVTTVDVAFDLFDQYLHNCYCYLPNGYGSQPYLNCWLNNRSERTQQVGIAVEIDGVVIVDAAAAVVVAYAV